MEVDCKCELGEEHIKQWLKAYRARQPDQGDTYFLWGTNEFEPDSPYPLVGTAYPKTESVQFIFPCIAAIHPSEIWARDDIDWNATHNGSYGANVGKYAVPNAEIRRQSADAGQGVDRYLDGYWICAKNLSNGDVISFYGEGPRDFRTKGVWEVHF